MFDPVSYVMGKQAGGGGGGGDITVESLSVTENGTKTAPSRKAYSPVVVNVPNTYTASDEGKVVSNGALVAQTAHAEVTQNGTIDTTLNNSVTVNVPSAETYLQLLARTFQGRLEDSTITKLGERALDHCTGITSVYLPNLTSAGSNCLYNCTGLVTAVFPAGTGDVPQISGSNKLKKYDSFGSRVYGNTFNSCSLLDMIVLRNTTMLSLQNTNAFNNTPFASSGAGGTLYVPASLVSSYTGASNWSTILGYANNQIKSIESTHTDPDAPIDLTLYYADGTLIPTT